MTTAQRVEPTGSALPIGIPVRRHRRRPGQRRVLVVGHGGLSSGFARVLHSLLERLAERYEFHHFSPYYRGLRVDGAWTLYPNARELDPYGFDQLPEMVRQLQPDLLVLVEDLTLVAVHLQNLRRLSRMPKTVVYTPYDDEPILPGLLPDVADIDRLVAYTRTARRVFETALDNLETRPPFPPIEVIPHGVDVARFRPLEGRRLGEIDRAASRRAWFGDDRYAGAFIVLNANRNHGRKRVDLTLKSFARFAQTKKDAYLWLHMGVEEPMLDQLARSRLLGIADRVITTVRGAEHPTLCDEDLNRVYDCCDVGINTSHTEGWGLLAFEHGATGAAQVLPDHGVRRELWRGAAVLVATEPIRTDMEEIRMADPDAVADSLERLYSDRVYLAEMSRRAAERALAPEYRWEVIADQWHRLFEEVLALRG